MCYFACSIGKCGHRAVVKFVCKGAFCSHKFWICSIRKGDHDKATELYKQALDLVSSNTDDVDSSSCLAF